LAIVVAAVDTRDEAVDASPDVDRIMHGPPEIDDPQSASRDLDLACLRALKRQEKADERVSADVASRDAPCEHPDFAGLS